ncbi:oligosaccharide 4-alpha-D-glucosyltransferase [Lutibacter agarilyticus]|uniref:Oligosaccharide 4-alpha-D-glucosyltransferase n=1 Tax=Lutibacter agarilyticus TaxID=1109740 RepID=A0A238X5Z4_9FLAO|nr:TIM-barrel domain-containing protein [Lutibacter agarilyticus]SNR53279.1 oligosaccharide 4-alpha-D-glucosyltransferase [Lutibacter agarilyticus]
MKFIKFNLITFLLIGFVVNAQNSTRKFESVTNHKTYVEVKTNDGLYRFQPYGNEIIETSFIPNGEAFNESSHAVVLKPTVVEMQLIKSVNETEIKMLDISVKIKHAPFQVSYYYEGRLLTSEKNGYSKNKEYEVLDFNLTSEEILYGGGARVLGMNRRGYRLELYNKAHYGYETHSELMNFTMPLVYSSKMYAIHFDNAPIGYLDLDSSKTNTLAYETISGRKTYQIIVGDDWKELVENYVSLTGFQPLIPRWALGNFSSRFGYHSQEETIETIDAFIEEEIPVDAIILDLYWFGKTVQGTMGNFEFDKDSFPNPEKMMKELKDKGVKTILITEPFVLTTSSKWNDAVEKNILGLTKEGKPYTYDFYFGNTGIIDIFKPEGADWFWNVYKKHIDLGVGGWWGDLGEPEVHPSDLLHATGTADEVHNIYGHNWAKLVYQGYQKYVPEQRPFILMRAGYSGSQHYGMIPWTGDVNRTWGGLQPQVEIALQMGMQGMGYMHSDLGGFAGPNLDDELYTRWLQYGVFQPIYRPHAQEDVPSEPVFRESKTKALAKKSIELRYSLLPYNYTISFENNQFGTPLMRPLFFEEPTNSVALNSKTTYLWGNEILVSPVVEPGLKQQEVYFPSNSNWYNFYNDEKVEGGQTVTIDLVEESIPTYVRGGAFIPRIQPIQNTAAYSLKSFDVHFYFDETVSESEYELYNDDGETPNAFEKGLYEIIEFDSEFKKNSLTIEIEQELGDNYDFSSKEIQLIIHNISKNPKKIKGYNYTWNEAEKTVVITVSLNDLKEKNIKIKL